jgi:hypothetical protein
MVVIFTGSAQIRMVRYDDDFRYLLQDSNGKQGTERLKYLSLPGGATVSFGGELREQIQYYNYINFGDVAPSSVTSTTWQLWSRVMAHANLDISKKVRVFVQFGSAFRLLNSNPATPEIEVNKLNLQQALLDVHNDKFTLRLGRQELSYGSHRVITFREGPNVRLAFNGAVIKHSSDKRKVDIFALSPIVSRPGAFDDETWKELLAGIYATETIVPKTFLLDYYLLDFISHRRQYNFAGGKEDRRTFGVRAFSERSRSNYDVEATYQFGKFSRQNISAYRISVDLSYQVLSSKNVTLGVAGNYASGDRDRNDGKLNTYNLLFSKPQYGLAAPIGATNIITLNPYVKARPIKRGSVYVGANFLWRQSVQDGTYSPTAIQIRPLPETLNKSKEKDLGTLLVLETNYFPNRYVSFAFDVSYFLAGRYVGETGKGKNITYLSFKGTYKF